MFFDLQSPAAAAEYPPTGKVLARYGLTPEVKQAVLANDVSFLSRRTNPYLCATFFFAAGMKDDEFIRRLRDG